MLNSQESEHIVYQVDILVQLTCVYFDCGFYMNFFYFQFGLGRDILFTILSSHLSLSLSLSFPPVFCLCAHSLLSCQWVTVFCLHTQVVSVAEYHRRIDALNTEELRTLCRRLQVPLLRSKLPQSDHALLLVSFLKTNLTLNDFVLTEALK